ncbi:hypothetical protein H0H92_006656 [Tricholoma furcatifolium]|nr:hypothetical protein H0H92_006656 [Tricholoma furcatifolium]
MSSLAQTLEKAGKYKEAEQFSHNVFVLRKKILGFSHPDTLASMYYLGIFLQNSGKLEDAQKLGQEYLTMCQTIYGAQHVKTFVAMTQLAFAYQKMHKWHEAQELLIEVLHSYQTMFHQNPELVDEPKAMPYEFPDQDNKEVG